LLRLGSERRPYIDYYVVGLEDLVFQSPEILEPVPPDLAVSSPVIGAWTERDEDEEDFVAEIWYEAHVLYMVSAACTASALCALLTGTVIGSVRVAESVRRGHRLCVRPRVA